MRKTQNYKTVPYNPKLRERARSLRKAGILHEVLLWNQLKSKKLNGLDFDRRKIIGNYIVDFYCAERNIIIEIDGYSHDNTNRQEYDQKRGLFLESLGLVIIHITAKDVLQNIEMVINFLQTTPSLRDTPPKEGN